MLRYLGGFVDRICAVLGAVLLAQAPLFMHQYILQLAGHEAELRMHVDAMRQAASISGKTLEQLTQKFIASGDVDFMQQGEFMLSMVSRLHNLSEGLSALQSSSVLSKPFVFLMHVKPDIFKSTLQHFTLGMPLSFEGAVYALLGILIGYLAFLSIRKLFEKAINFYLGRVVN